jgi:chromosome segregation ATPase
MRLSLLVVLCGLALASLASADVVHLKDGSKREGKIVAQDEESLRLAVTLGTMSVEVMIPKDRIERIEQKETQNEQVLQEYRQRLAKMDDASADSWFKLGGWCEEQKYLAKQATQAFETALELDPGHEGARRKLGHVRHNGEWLTPAQALELQAKESPKAEPATKTAEKSDAAALFEQYFGQSVEEFRERAAKAEADLAAERKLRHEAQQKVKELEERIARLERQVARSSVTVQDRRPIIIIRDKKENDPSRPRTQGTGEETPDKEATDGAETTPQPPPVPEGQQN